MLDIVQYGCELSAVTLIPLLVHVAPDQLFDFHDCECSTCIDLGPDLAGEEGWLVMDDGVFHAHRQLDSANFSHNIIIKEV